MNGNSKLMSTPLAPHFKLSVSLLPSMEEERDYMAQISYASLVGSLMYAMVCTRPDIAQVVSMVNHYMHDDPGKVHWQATR